MNKTIRIGVNENGNIYCKISFKNGKLSITGVEGPLVNGDCRGSCGQINMHDWNIQNYATGWDDGLARQFREVWDKWHLNDMQAGSPAQEAYLAQNPIKAVYPESHYTKASEALTAAGLNPDPNYTHNGNPYSYGSAWLKKDVPDEVVAFLHGLPATDITPAWV